ncbi:MAG: dienelactone hydrolase family protein [Armatimonadetes bacterium]|nr:dienelactone hydrolase family protein [Armatimonadota bacterium]
MAAPKHGGPHPGLLVFQEIFGVNVHIRDVTERFAAEGYLAVAPELFHRTAPGFECAYEDLETAWQQRSEMTEEGVAADVRAAWQWLQDAALCDRARTAALGFCMGGTVAFATACTVGVKAAVSFYGGAIAQTLLGRVPDLQAPVLLFWGGLDRHIKVEHTRAVVDALREHGKPHVNVEFSDADHGFFCDRRGTYHPAAARKAWVLTLEFLKTHLEGG